MRQSLLILIALAGFLALAVINAPTPHPSGLPQEMLMDGEPIAPLCFLKREAGTGQYLPLKYCEDGYSIAEDDGQYELDGGWRGTRFTNDTDGWTIGMSMPSIQYRYLGQIEGQHIIWLITNGGGTGYFSEIQFLERQGDAFLIKDIIVGGDRCNGGFEDAGIRDGKLWFDVRLTPWNFLMSARDKPDYNYGWELSDCAACCVATAHYIDGEINGVSLSQDGHTLSAEDDNTSPQACFDNLFTLNIEHGNIHFDLEEYKTFAREIDHVCLGRMEGE